MLRRRRLLVQKYLQRKDLEWKERVNRERNRKINETIYEKLLNPIELRNEEAKLHRDIDLKDEQMAVPRTLIIDEYSSASERDPKILLTTTRNPSDPLNRFVKELKFIFPNAQKINRGDQTISGIMETCRKQDFTAVILVSECQGEPNGLIICHLPFGLTAYFQLYKVVMRSDVKDKNSMGRISMDHPHLLLTNFSNEDDEKTAKILKGLFPVPKLRSERSISMFMSQEDYILVRHIIKEKCGPKSHAFMEAGPRFDMQLCKVKEETLDQQEAKTLWDFAPSMNDSKKHSKKRKVSK